jgi:hypothetical protein
LILGGGRRDGANNNQGDGNSDGPLRDDVTYLSHFTILLVNLEKKNSEKG